METMVNASEKLREGWISTTLGEACELIMGQSPPSTAYNGTRHGLPFFQGKTEFGVMHPVAVKWCSEPNKIAEPGDVLLSVRAPVGPTNLADQQCCIGRGLSAVRPQNGTLSKYVLYYLRSIEPSIDALGTGTTFKAVSGKVLRDLPFPLAPLPQQRRIVSAIELQLGRLDAAVARLHAAKAKLKRYKQAVLKAAFSGKMTEVWRAKAKVTPVDKMLARIETPPRPSRYKSRSMDVVDGDYALAIGAPERQGPTGWKWLPLVDIARLESGHTPSKRHPEYWEGDVPWIELRDARDRHGATIDTTTYHTNQLGLDNSAARLLPTGTVCLSRTASVGYVVKMGVPMCTSQDFVNWICTEAIEPDWLKLLFVAENDAIWRFGKGTTHTTVYFPEVVSFHVLLPPIEEQREIVRLVGAALATTEEIETTLDAELVRSTRLRQAVLKRAFEGRLID